MGLRERRSTPQRQPRRLSPAAKAEILAARRRSGAGPVTLGALLGRPASTVGKVLQRLSHSRRPRGPRPPVVRYERAQPGELLHLDTKRLAPFWHVGKRIYGDDIRRSPRAGWQHDHQIAVRVQTERELRAPPGCRAFPGSDLWPPPSCWPMCPN